MKKSIFLVIFILIWGGLSAQNFEWAKSFGGTNNDVGYSTAIDSQGNVFSTGSFRGIVDFDPGIGTYTLTAFGFSDIFITKLDINGNFIWAKQIGGSDYDEGHAITLDNADNIFISGYFSDNADFDPNIGTTTLVSNGSTDLFVSKYDSQGNLLWAKSAGSVNADEALAITTDQQGNVYATGSFYDTVDFNPGTGINNLVADLFNYTAFILKLDNNGNYVWAKSIYGNPSSSQGYSIKVDLIGNVFVTGYYSGNTDFDPNSGTYILNFLGSSYDTFILKLNSSGSFLWANGLGGVNSNCSANDIIIDEQKNSYITGYFSGTVNFNPNAGTNTITSNGQYDAYLLKLDSLGNFIWVKTIGGSGDDYGIDLIIDQSKNIFLMGDFSTTVDFNPGIGINNVTSAGNFDVYILKLDSLGNYIFAGNIGGVGMDLGYSLAIDSLKSIYVSGAFNGTADYNPGSGNTILTSNGLTDVFVLKINTSRITQLNNFQELNFAFINIYPNPNNGNFSIVAKETMNLNLSNNLGQIIQTIELNESNNYEENVKVSTSGIYFITGQSAHESVKHKIIVIK